MPHKLRFASVLIAASAVACVPDFDDDLSKIDSPRLLALRATPAEAKENGDSELEALIAVPDGEEAPKVQFGLCLARKPLTQLGPNGFTQEPSRSVRTARSSMADLQ